MITLAGVLLTHKESLFLTASYGLSIITLLYIRNNLSSSISIRWHHFFIHVVHVNVSRNMVVEVLEIRHESSDPLIVVYVRRNLTATQWLYNVNQRRLQRTPQV